MLSFEQNWQQGALKAQRRNKWICALKNALAAAKIYGPGGDPNAPGGPQQVTLVPYHDPSAPQSPAPAIYEPEPERTDYAFSDARAARIAQGTANVFGDDDDMRHGGVSGIATPAAGLSRLNLNAGLDSAESTLRSRKGTTTPPGPSPTGGQTQTHDKPPKWAPANEEIEMVQGPSKH